MGWRGLFIVSGVVGIIWAFVWYFLYRDPDKHKKISVQEYKLIEEGGGLIGRKKMETEKMKFEWSELAEAFKHR